MRCPHCGSTDSDVIDTRKAGGVRSPVKDKDVIVRKRVCNLCCETFITDEKARKIEP